MSTNVSTCKCGAVSFRVTGEPISKANNRKLIFRKGRPMFIKSKKALALVDIWSEHCPVIDPLIEHDVAVWLKLTYASRRPDLDESLVLDLMQGRIIKNDRQVKEKHVYWALDQNDPHSVAVLMPMDMLPCIKCQLLCQP